MTQNYANNLNYKINYKGTYKLGAEVAPTEFETGALTGVPGLDIDTIWFELAPNTESLREFMGPLKKR